VVRHLKPLATDLCWKFALNKRGQNTRFQTAFVVEITPRLINTREQSEQKSRSRFLNLAERNNHRSSLCKSRFVQKRSLFEYKQNENTLLVVSHVNKDKPEVGRSLQN